ncbi:MAG: RluA family pseudouridine synthase [Lactobacillus sp.]|jgi:23S rRNA pseudouridine955/2504/2580 synthase|nr:RluA family pseudouridine synthase [Lactobacillus sp.]
MAVQLVKVKEQDDGMRLNRWFLKYYPDLPLSRLQKLLRTKQIKVDGKKAETNLKLESGQEIRIPPMEDKPKEQQKRKVSAKDAEFINSIVIYKDDNIIVLNKPSGIAVQGGTNTTRHIDGMLDALKFENEEAPKLVHRIDKNTSGLLVLARNRKYAEALTKGFKEHELPKTYLALVRGVPKKKSGEINAPLEKVGEKSIVVGDGKKAVSAYEVVDTVGERFSLVRVCPLTGRTHQIRAHMEYIGTPIVGDDRYFGDERKKYSILSDKLHLHSYKINLSSIYNAKMEIKAPLPDYFKQDLKEVGIQFKD